MGRPIKKNKMSGGANDFGGDLTGKLAVTAYRPFGGAKVDSTTAYIVNQRGSKKFKIHMDDSSEAVLKLVAVAPGSLANDDASGLGQFCVQIILDDSTVAYVSKFFNRTVHYVTAGGATGRSKYTLGTDIASDPSGTPASGFVNIDIIS
mgnify:CR=1 FL=1|jgi:hypothetical protein